METFFIKNVELTSFPKEVFPCAFCGKEYRKHSLSIIKLNKIGDDPYRISACKECFLKQKLLGN